MTSHEGLPRWRCVRQDLVAQECSDVASKVRRELQGLGALETVRHGSRIGICVGSRGITSLEQMVSAVAAAVREVGSLPFVIPAMGSHGGATPEGQVRVLAELGVTERSVGAPIRATMDTVRVARTQDGLPIVVDRIALEEMDYIIPIARVKPHTDFRGDLESGIHKMLTIGLGNRVGASTMHKVPISQLPSLLAEAGGVVLKAARVLAAIAVVEDGHHHPGIIEAIAARDIPEREPVLLRVARGWLPRLPFRRADVLIVQEMGKDISGAGMDPNVTGRYPEDGMGRQGYVADFQRVVVLDLSSKSNGNAAGIGMADIVTRRLAEKIDWQQTYTNHRTARLLSGAKLPLVAASDRDAVEVAVDSLVWRSGIGPQNGAKIAWIHDTLNLGQLWVSEALYEDVREMDGVATDGKLTDMEFCDDGTLCLAGRGGGRQVTVDEVQEGTGC